MSTRRPRYWARVWRVAARGGRWDAGGSGPSLGEQASHQVRLLMPAAQVRTPPSARPTTMPAAWGVEARYGSQADANGSGRQRKRAVSWSPTYPSPAPVTVVALLMKIGAL